MFVGEGLLGAGAPGRAAGRRFLVTDEAVGALYAERLGDVARDVRIPPGEEHKTLQTSGACCARSPAAGMAHGDHVVALGGGVVGDVAGFCAAVYQRGVPVVQVPTTVVAQVDSAYGGKTGVDLPEGKNYAGAYHQPAAVLADPSTLATLPPEEHAAGWAEVVKTGLIAGGRCGGGCARARGCSPTATSSWRARARSCGSWPRTSATPAAARPSTSATRLDTRSRPSTGYRRYRHGEAVGLGLLAALTLSEQPELRDEVAELLAGQGCRPRSTPPSTAPRWPPPSSATRSAAAGASASSWSRRRGARAPAAGGGGRPARRYGRVDAMKTRVAVMHGVNLDMLGRRPPGALRRPLADQAGAPDRPVRARARARRALLPDQPRGRVRRGAAPRRRLRRRPDPQPGRLDALRVGDPRRARDRRAARGRGPPVRPREPRGVAPHLGDRRPRAWRAWPARAPRATATRSQYLKDAL